MARNGAAPSSIPNRLLSHLQPEHLERLRPDLKLVPLRVKDILHARGDRLEHAYFPLSGMVSFVVRVDDGYAVEVGTVGNEGMVGVQILVGLGTGLHEAMVQMEGEALRIPASKLGSRSRRCRSPPPAGPVPGMLSFPGRANGSLQRCSQFGAAPGALAAASPAQGRF